MLQLVCIQFTAWGQTWYKVLRVMRLLEGGPFIITENLHGSSVIMQTTEHRFVEQHRSRCPTSSLIAVTTVVSRGSRPGRREGHWQRRRDDPEPVDGRGYARSTRPTDFLLLHLHLSQAVARRRPANSAHASLIQALN